VLVLGVIDSKPSSAAVLDGGRIVAALAEERLCRMKMAGGMPRQAIAEVLRIAGVGPGDLDAVGVAQTVCVFEPEVTPWAGWFEGGINEKASHFDRLGSALAPVVGAVPGALAVHRELKRWVFRDRRTRLPALLREAYGISAPVRFFDHHLCHAASAYYTSGFEDALVVTLDGGGDGLSGGVYEAAAGRLRRLHAVESFHSLGNFYSYVTELCGFKAERHEGKITGLAAYGEPIYLERLRAFVGYEEPGRIRYHVPMYHRSALRRLAEALPADFDRADLAASVQQLLEEVALAFVSYWLRRTGARRLCLAGGVFGNVRLNHHLHSLPEVEEISVHPAMDDSGLGVGAALLVQAHRSGADPAKLCGGLAHVSLGPGWSDAAIEASLAHAGLATPPEPQLHAAIARALAQGAVVARFHGRMEYGPRALGNRSILVQATDPSVNTWLNERLSRTEFMPFAPATLSEEADACYAGLDGARDPARFMTLTFECTPQMRKNSPGVVHLDGTARPQLVDRDTAPDFHGILSAYHEATGLPSLVNTSFNLHEEPIVCTPEDAIRAFREGQLHYLAIGRHLVAHPERPFRAEEAGT
jgi:carbamoyltransferase